MARKRRKRYHAPGTQPGTLAAHAEAGDAPVRITSFLYDANRCEERTVSPSEISSLSPPEGGVLWLDVCGLSDPSVVRAIGDRFRIHSLALEDVLNVPQRPKVEWYGDHLLVVLPRSGTRNFPNRWRFCSRTGWSSPSRSAPGDAFEPVRERLRQGKGRIRAEGADYLLYSLCDAVLDAFFPTLERLGDEVEEMEETGARLSRAGNVPRHPAPEAGTAWRCATPCGPPGTR